jgi:hypothetical protein
MSIGLSINSCAIIIVVITGWYQRANMVANSKMSAIVLYCTLIITILWLGYTATSNGKINKEQQYFGTLAEKKRFSAK